MALDVEALMRDEKKMKQLVASASITEAQRPALWRRCVQHRTHLAQDSALYSAACERLYPSHPSLPQFFPLVPDFGSPVEWEYPDVLPRPAQQQRAQQSLLCLLAAEKPTLTHCPYVVDLLPLLLRYYDDATTFTLLHSMVSVDFYFTRNSGDYLVFLKKFYLFFKDSNERLKHQLKHCGIDVVTVFSQWVNRLYVGFLPESSVLRFMDGFLYWGQLWLWAFALAMLNVHTKALQSLQTIEAISDYVFNEVSSDDVDKYLSTAVELLPKLSRWNDKVKPKDIERYAMGSVPAARETLYTVPAFSPAARSEMVTDDQLCALFCWLEPEQRVCRPALLYASSRDGYLLKTMLERCTTPDPQQAHGPTFTVVKATSGAVFGVYLSASWVKESDAAALRAAAIVGDSEKERKREEERRKNRLPSADGRCFLFQLQPRLVCYRQSQQRLERLRQRKEREDREKARRSLMAGRDGLRHRTSSQQSSSASQHLSAALHHGSSSFIHAELETDPFTPSSHRPAAAAPAFPFPPPAAAAAAGDGDGSAAAVPGGLVSRSELAKQLQALLDSQGAEEAEGGAAVHMMCSAEHVAIGDSSGVAFSLDQLLRQGVSQHTRSFVNPDLSEAGQADGSFRCLAVEVWGFRQPHE